MPLSIFGFSFFGTFWLGDFNTRLFLTSKQTYSAKIKSIWPLVIILQALELKKSSLENGEKIVFTGTNTTFAQILSFSLQLFHFLKIQARKLRQQSRYRNFVFGLSSQKFEGSFNSMDRVCRFFAHIWWNITLREKQIIKLEWYQ